MIVHSAVPIHEPYVPREQAIEAAEDRADQVWTDTWRERS